MTHKEALQAILQLTDDAGQSHLARMVQIRRICSTALHEALADVPLPSGKPRGRPRKQVVGRETRDAVPKKSSTTAPETF